MNSLRRKLDRSPEQAEAYEKQLLKYVDNGYAKLMYSYDPSTRPGADGRSEHGQHFLPHHLVKKEDRYEHEDIDPKKMSAEMRREFEQTVVRELRPELELQMLANAARVQEMNPGNRLAELLVEERHRQHHHPGTNHLGIVRRKYWIIAGRELCKRMADLPTIRDRSTRPFGNTAVDMFGPYTINVGRTGFRGAPRTQKRYGLRTTDCAVLSAGAG